MSETLTLRQFAALVPCSDRTVRNALHGRFRRYAILPRFWMVQDGRGEAWVVDAQSVKEWLEERERQREVMKKPHLMWPVRAEEKEAA